MKIRLLLICVLLFQNSFYAQETKKPRVIILSDIEADPDDTQSFVRLFLYSNEIDLKGLIATTSCWHKNSVNPESIKKIVDAYGKVQSNLLKHSPEFPTAKYLESVISKGLPKYGQEGIGEGLDSEGSELIIKELEKDDNRPLYIPTWGGVNTLAQSLYKIRKTQTKAKQKEMIAKLRVYTISDQDDSGYWIRENFPDLFYIVTPTDDYEIATWSAINMFVKGIDNNSIKNQWIAENIQQGHGALGAAYPNVSWGVEGDTPSFLFLVPNGLNNPEYPNWGGWGGRYEYYKPNIADFKDGSSDVPLKAETRSIWTNASDTYNRYTDNDYGRAVKKDTTAFKGNKVTLWRWRDDFQNDFAARMDWCIKSFKEANHKPVIKINKEDQFTVKSGQGFGIDAFESFDPDGDSISFLWYAYPEAGTSEVPIKIEQPENAHQVYLTAPKVNKKATAHIILEVSDKGEPKLKSYKRIVVTIEP